MLIDDSWPEVMTSLKKGYQVFGLTKMNTGEFGNIKSMEEWRFNELQSLNISFSQPQKENGAVEDSGFLDLAGSFPREPQCTSVHEDSRTKATPRLTKKRICNSPIIQNSLTDNFIYTNHYV